MKQKKSILSKIIYWAVSSLIIILLFVGIFGILPVLIENFELNVTAVIGFIIGGIGAAVIFNTKKTNIEKVAA